MLLKAPDRLPARALPLLYFGAAHVSLALACLFAALWPRAVTGFFYHPWLIGLVHLVTLGWISFSILGAFYIVGPIALRMEMPARRMDYVAYVLAVAGLVGMVGHFWIQQYAGMAWSAGTIAIGIVYMTARIVVQVRRAHVQRAVKAHIVLACCTFWVAASMGLLIAIDKTAHFLPGFVLANVFAHAHLAALGWAAMMIVGVGYRMLPMIFPSKMPSGRAVYGSAVLLEIGVLGLFTTLLLRGALAFVFGLSIVAGLAVFGGHVVWMRRRLVPKPVAAPTIDVAVLHAAAAGAALIVSAGLGLALLIQPASPRMLHLAAAYGVLGLIGFLAQMIVAMETRLLPLATWMWMYTASGYRVPPPSPHTMRVRALQWIAFATWTVGVPALAAGMFFESAMYVAIAAWSLFAGVVITTFDNASVVIHGIRGTRPPRARRSVMA